VRIAAYGLGLLAVVAALVAGVLHHTPKQVCPAFALRCLAQRPGGIYVAQTARGAASGVRCADAHGLEWFESARAWGAGRRHVHPGSVVHLCGTISSTVSIRGQGAPGRPITIVFQPGAKLSQPVCSPCLQADGASYVTVYGWRDGTIESTQDGSSLPDHAAAVGIEAMGCRGCTFSKLTIADMYVHTSPADDSIDQTQDNAIRFSGHDLTIADNTIHDVGWALYASWSNGDGHVRIYGNRIWRVDHGFISSSGFAGGSIGPIYFYDNWVGDFANWDTTDDAYHHDGVHCYTADGAGTASHYSGLYIYDNRFGGTVGADTTADIFIEGAPRHDAYDTPCADAGSRVYIFDNVLTSTDRVTDNAYLSDSAGGGGIYNNTVIGESRTANIGGCSGYGDQPPGGRVAFKDNVLTTCDNLINGSAHGDFLAGSPDYNVYANGGINSFFCDGRFYPFADFRRWRRCVGADRHSRALRYARLAADGAPRRGSPVLRAGENLSWLCHGPLVALCRTITGARRPRHGPWEAGAY
jgi:hypothetical protein